MENNQVMDSDIQKFADCIKELGNQIQILMKYDFFAANAIIAVLDLMMSKSPEFIESCQIQMDKNIKIPTDIKEDIDSIIQQVKNSLNK